ncbi:MAG: YbaN family protein [Sphingomonadaceae bacterium]
MKRPLYFALGTIFVGLGLIGAVLPIMPTVPFLIVAAFFFARSHPQLAERLYQHPTYGKSLRDWRDRSAIGRRAKYLAIGGMSAGVIFTWFTVGFPIAWISVAILAIFGPWICGPGPNGYRCWRSSKNSSASGKFMPARAAAERGGVLFQESVEEGEQRGAGDILLAFGRG